MWRRWWSSTLPLWAAAAALVLKAGVPVLAALAAHVQGVPVAAVCDVYGVTLRSADPHAGHHGHAAAHTESAAHDDSGDHETPPHSDGKHRGDHCALTGLSVMALSDTAALPSAGSTSAPTPAPWAGHASIHDRCAAWIARLLHAPPLRAA
jgi:hypothetical protein